MDGKNQNELNNKDRPKEVQLTPWQKENNEYLKKRANETNWEKRNEKNRKVDIKFYCSDLHTNILFYTS